MPPEQQIPDYIEREACLNTSESYIVQAPAGSGKTTLLVSRFMRLLPLVKDPKSIVAITFTRKAAAEMRERILEDLKKENDSLIQAIHKQDAKYGWNLLQQPKQLQIKTIDSFTQQILNKTPATHKALVFPCHENTSSFYKQAALLLLQQMQEDSAITKPMQTILTHYRFNQTSFINCISNLLQKRDQWYDLPTEFLQAHKSITQEHILEELTQITQAFLDKLTEEQKLTLVNLLQCRNTNLLNETTAKQKQPSQPLITSLKAENIEAFAELGDLFLTNHLTYRKSINKKSGFPPECKEEKAQWKNIKEDFEKSPSITEQLKVFLTFPTHIQSNFHWKLADAIIAILPQAIEALRTVFSQNEHIDFTEAAICALEALGSEEDITDLLLSIDQNIQHLLIDEFQDTSPIQFKLFDRLLEGWYEGDGRTFFAVGDPMQSIYGFRDADLQLFMRVKSEGIANIRPTPIQLSSNFRSNEALINANNILFEKVFHNKSVITQSDITFAPSTHPFPQESYTTKTNENTENNENSPMQIQCFSSHEQEIKWIINRIKQIQRASPQETSIAILVRKRKNLASIIEGLNQHQLAWQGEKIENLTESIVIEDLFTLSEAIYNPSNQTILTLLRTPFCGIELQDLLILTSKEPEQLPHNAPSIFASTPIIARIMDKHFIKNLSSSGKIQVQKIADILKNCIEQRNSWSVQSTIRYAWLHLNAQIAYTEVHTTTCIQHANAFLHQLENIQPTEIVEHIIHLRSESIYLNFASNNTDLIQIMTIHNAKGLQFDHVFIPRIEESKSNNSSSALIIANNSLQRITIVAEAYEQPDDTIACYKWVKTLNKEKDAQELKRLLYVGATRAKHYTYLTGTATEESVQQISSTPKSLLDCIKTFIADTPSNIFEANKILSEQVLHDQDSVISNKKDTKANDALTKETKKYHFPLTTIRASTPRVIQQTTTLLTPKHDQRIVASKEQQVGTVIHQILKALAEKPLPTFNEYYWKKIEPFWQIMLINNGMESEDTPNALVEIKACVQNIIKSDLGKWILDYQHPLSYTEKSFFYKEISSSMADGTAQRYIIDRCFLDKDEQTYWIIDYKHTHKPQKSIERFIQKQTSRYTQQLKQYANILENYFKGRYAITTALYFTNLDKLQIIE